MLVTPNVAATTAAMVLLRIALLLSRFGTSTRFCPHPNPPFASGGGRGDIPPTLFRSKVEGRGDSSTLLSSLALIAWRAPLAEAGEPFARVLRTSGKRPGHSFEGRRHPRAVRSVDQLLHELCGNRRHGTDVAREAERCSHHALVTRNFLHEAGSPRLIRGQSSSAER